MILRWSAKTRPGSLLTGSPSDDELDLVTVLLHTTALEDHDGATYRAVYTVKFSTGIYVLHAFQKESKKGIATPKREIDLIGKRLKEAEVLHQARTMEDPEE